MMDNYLIFRLLSYTGRISFPVKNTLVLLLFIALFLTYCKKENSSTSSIPQKKSDLVDIAIKWEYKDFPLEMELYEPAASRPITLWDTGSSSKTTGLPFSTLKIEDSSLHLKPGSRKQFVLVAKNNSDKPIYFFAAPHQVVPAEYSLGFKFKCLCINHAFKIGPKETWYRVVEFRVSNNFVGDKMDVTHTLIGITEDRMKDFENGGESGHGQHNMDMD